MSRRKRGRFAEALAMGIAVVLAGWAYLQAGWTALSYRKLLEGDGGVFPDPEPFAEAPGASAAWWIGLGGFVLCAAWTVRLAGGDLRAHRLPNRDLLIATLGTVVPLSFAAWLVDQPVRNVDGLVGAVVVTAPLLLLWLLLRGFGRPAIGAGDVKLAPLVGFVPGWLLSGSVAADPFSVFPAMAVFGALGGVFTLLRQGRGSEFAFGPALLAAMWFSSFIWPWMMSVGPQRVM